MNRTSSSIFVLVVILGLSCQSSSAPSSVALVEAPADGDLAAYVAGELARGQRDRVPVLVYVGATWCKPCHELQDAVVRGSLDAELAPLRLLVFDLDRDGDRLRAAGYRSDLVPLFARPGPDGRASGVQSDGVRSGGAYVEQLVPRIKALVATAP